MKKDLSTIFLVLVLLIGSSLLLYPTVSDYWNSLHQSQAIAEYAEKTAELDDAAYEHLWEEARAYNEALPEQENRFAMTEEEEASYRTLLNISGTGVMGYIEIPSIDCFLPIYHGTEESVLQIAAGHIEGSSLPIGGEGTHSALSGHRGLPSAKLFTNLDKLEKGDQFMIRVLDEVLVYEVDRILIVEPQNLSGLEIEPGQDYCTLVTCTPYGINSHRLLVRGHRIENEREAALVRVTADAIQIEPMLVAIFIAAPMLLLLIVWMIASTGKKAKAGSKRTEA